MLFKFKKIILGSKTSIAALVKIIENINSNRFFDEVLSKIILVDETNDINKEITTSSIYDLVIEIRLRKGKIVHFTQHLDPKFGDEFLAIWDKEIVIRGLEYSTSELKREIFEDYKEVKFATPKPAHVEAVIKGLYVLQLLMKSILRNGKLPMAVWNPHHPRFENWQAYFSIHPIVAGVIDGAIDEIDMMPIGIFALYELMQSRDVEKSILDRFLSTPTCKGLIETYQTDNQMNLVESQHKAAQATISVGRMLGFVKREKL